MIMTHLLQFLRLHAIVGAVYVALNRCLWIVGSFVVTYGTITIAFTCGMHFILKSSRDNCLPELKGFTNETTVEHNPFMLYHKSLKTLFWSMFDPGHPELVGPCTGGVARYVALILWACYNVMVVIVLLNLLIALMGGTMSSIQKDKASVHIRVEIAHT